MRRRSPASELSGLERAGNAVSGRAEFTPPRGRAPRLLCSLAPSLGDAESQRRYIPDPSLKRYTALYV